MKILVHASASCLLLFCIAASILAQSESQSDLQDSLDLRVMTWNIWHGGKEVGAEVGPKRVAEIIRESGADIIALQETYGSGEWLAKELGFHFHSRGTNVSLLSRHEIVADVSVNDAFNCVGAVIELPEGNRVVCYSIWLPYAEDIWVENARKQVDVPKWLAACEPSRKKLEAIRDEIELKLRATKYDSLPIIIAGDFNSMSHLDYVSSAIDQCQAEVDWPTSHMLVDHQYQDTYRACNPKVDRRIDRTWSPRFPLQEQDRIDFIYIRDRAFQAVESKTIDKHSIQFPSDHAAVLTRFRYLQD